MKEEIPKCKDCNQSMFEVGGIGKNIQITRPQEWSRKLADGRTESGYTNEIIGVREEKLYQCPECKEVKLQ